MPPRKGTQRSRLERQPTQFGQLDTTPTSHHCQAPEKTPFNKTLNASKKPSNATQSSMQPVLSQSSVDYTQELDDEALLELGDCLAMSKSGSNSHPSSPADAPTPHSIWDFDSISLFNSSSPNSGTGKLPDTLPIPDSLPAGRDGFPAERRVDLSETASTGRRSSPYDNHTDINWDFATTPGGATSHIDDDLAATPGGNFGMVQAEVELARPRAATLSEGLRRSNALDEIADSFEGIQHGPSASARLGSLDISSEELVSSPPPDPAKASNVESVTNSAQSHHRVPKHGVVETSEAPEESSAVMTVLNQEPGQKRRQRAKSPFKCPQTKQQESRRSTKINEDGLATPSNTTTTAKRPAPKGKSGARKKAATASRPRKTATAGKANRKGKSAGSKKDPATSELAAAEKNSPVSNPKPTSKTAASKKVNGREEQPQGLFIPSPRAKEDLPQGRKTRQARAAAPAREALIISSDSSSNDESDSAMPPVTSGATAREAKPSDSNLSLVDTQPFLVLSSPPAVVLSANYDPGDIDRRSGTDHASNEPEVAPESLPSLFSATVLSPPPPPSPRRFKRKSDEHESPTAVAVTGQTTVRSDDKAHDEPANIKRRRLPNTDRGNDAKACATVNPQPDSAKISQKKSVVSSKEVEVTSDGHKLIVNNCAAQTETPTTISSSVTRSKNQASAVKSSREEPMAVMTKEALQRDDRVMPREEKSRTETAKVLPRTIPNSQENESPELDNESIEVDWQWDASEPSSNSQPATPVLLSSDGSSVSSKQPSHPETSRSPRHCLFNSKYQKTPRSTNRRTLTVSDKGSPIRQGVTSSILPELDVEHSPELRQRPPRGRLFAASAQAPQSPSGPERSPAETSIEKEQEADTFACRVSRRIPRPEISTEALADGRKSSKESKVAISGTTPQSALAEAMHGIVRVLLHHLEDATDVFEDVNRRYQSGMSESIECIMEKAKEERRLHSEEAGKDLKRFERYLDESRRTLAIKMEDQKVAMKELQEFSAQRQLVYNEAINSLERLSQQITSSKTPASN